MTQIVRLPLHPDLDLQGRGQVNWGQSVYVQIVRFIRSTQLMYMNRFHFLHWLMLLGYVIRIRIVVVQLAERSFLMPVVRSLNLGNGKIM